MKGTGIIRRVDDSGKIAIPRTIRAKMGIAEGTPLEIFFDEETISFKKYTEGESLAQMMHELKSSFDELRHDIPKETAGKIKTHIDALDEIFKNSRKDGAGVN